MNSAAVPALSCRVHRAVFALRGMTCCSMATVRAVLEKRREGGYGKAVDNDSLLSLAAYRPA
jgi:hypothetical protein